MEKARVERAEICRKIPEACVVKATKRTGDERRSREMRWRVEKGYVITRKNSHPRMPLVSLSKNDQGVDYGDCYNVTFHVTSLQPSGYVRQSKNTRVHWGTFLHDRQERPQATWHPPPGKRVLEPLRKTTIDRNCPSRSAGSYYTRNAVYFYYFISKDWLFVVINGRSRSSCFNALHRDARIIRMTANRRRFESARFNALLWFELPAY